MDPDGPLSEAFSRKTYLKVSIYFSWLFLHTGITPNQVTIMSIILGLAGNVLITQHGWYPLMGLIFYQFWLILDTVDGDIARYRKICSMSGAFLDRLNNAIVCPLMYISLSYGVYVRLGDLRVLFFGFLVAMSLLLLKVVNAYLHVAILEPVLHKKHVGMIRIPEKGDLESGMLNEYFNYKPSSCILRISEFLLTHGLYLSFYGVVLLDSILNFSFHMFSLELNFSYLYLIMLGPCLTMAWIVIAAYIVRKRAPESLYVNLFSQ